MQGTQPEKWNGLAGQSAAEQARRARDEAPVRSLLDRLLGNHSDERAWRRGAQGEREVGRRLARLDPKTWTVLHDLPLGDKGANIDHLVIGSPGVFTLNAKNLSGRVWVAERVLMQNGHRTDYLPKATAEARKVAFLLTAATGLPVSVRPVVVIMGAELTVKSQPPDVDVISRRRIHRWLETRPRALDESSRLAISGAASLKQTWAPVVRVKEWKRYGKHRLYVADDSGRELGYLDMSCGDLQLSEGADRVVVEAALDDYLAARGTSLRLILSQ